MSKYVFVCYIVVYVFLVAIWLKSGISGKNSYRAVSRFTLQQKCSIPLLIIKKSTFNLALYTATWSKVACEMATLGAFSSIIRNGCACSLYSIASQRFFIPFIFNCFSIAR